MSLITFSLVLLLLWSSFQCINARSLGIFHEYDQPSNGKKNDEIKSSNQTRVSIEPDHMRKPTPNETRSEKKLEKKKVNRKSNEPEKKVESKRTGPRKPESSVTWKVPHDPKKKGDEQEVPGFNLDYLPPKTHPPVHN